MTALKIALAVLLVPVAFAFALARIVFLIAPEGWEDADGFHYGRPPLDSEPNVEDAVELARHAESRGARP